MLIQRFITLGGVEITLGGLWLLYSALSIPEGIVAPAAFGVDVLAFVALVVATRCRLLGVVLMGAVLLGSMGLDPTSYGVTGILSLVVVVALLRREQMRLAVVHTTVTFVLGTVVSYRSDIHHDIVWAALTWLVAAGVSWALGIGFLGHRRLYAARERAKHDKARLELASDLHDFVARDLTVIAMRADAAIKRGGATVAELEAIAGHSRVANEFLRETARQLGDGTPGGNWTRTIAAALDQGRQELAGLGREMVVEGELPAVEPVADAVWGRILLEALHNAAKHGKGEVQVVFDNTPSHLSVSVANISKHNPSIGGSSLGLDGIRRRTAVFGGAMTTELDGSAWVTRVTMPASFGSGDGEKKNDSSRPV